MDLLLKNTELKTIYQEYKDFFPQIEIKLASGLLANLGDGIISNRTSHLKITTEESKTFKVSVDLKGWFIIGREESFETFETLMNQVSSSFSKSFGGKLIEKLNLLHSN